MPLIIAKASPSKPSQIEDLHNFVGKSGCIDTRYTALRMARNDTLRKKIHHWSFLCISRASVIRLFARTIVCSGAGF